VPETPETQPGKQAQRQEQNMQKGLPESRMNPNNHLFICDCLKNNKQTRQTEFRHHNTNGYQREVAIFILQSNKRI
jgi:hypothetical protein